jgi:hypothetical protein
MKPGMTEHEHHAWGALLKYLEAYAIAYRYDRYPRNSKTGKKFDRLLKATRELRDQLNWECGWVMAENSVGRTHYQVWLEALSQALTSGVYHGDELRNLQSLVFFYLEEGPSEREFVMLGCDACEREEMRAVFMEQIGKLVSAAQSQTKELSWKPAGLLPIALPAMPLPTERLRVDRQAELRSAMRENPDQPQAAFVKQFRVHPITVRRTRRELEETGVIPVLSHRHGPSLAPAVT